MTRYWLYSIPNSTHLAQMAHARHVVLGNCRKMCVADSFLRAEGTDDGRDLGVVRVLYSWKKVMLNLVVQATIEPA